MKYLTRVMLIPIASFMAVWSDANALQLGPLPDWKEGAVDIVVIDGGEPRPIGAIDEDGRIDLDLPAGIDAEQTIGEFFACPYDGDISISAPDATFLAWPSLLVVRLAEQEMLGELNGFSSEEYAGQWRASLSAGNDSPEGGSQFNWIHVSEPVRVEGRCEVDFQLNGAGTAPVRKVTEYAMELDAGWQLLETQTRATATSQRDVTFAVDTLMAAAAPESERVSWVVLLEN